MGMPISHPPARRGRRPTRGACGRGRGLPDPARDGLDLLDLPGRLRPHAAAPRGGAGVAVQSSRRGGAAHRTGGRGRSPEGRSRRCCPRATATSRSTRRASSRVGRSTVPPCRCWRSSGSRSASTPVATSSSGRTPTCPPRTRGRITWRVGVEDPLDRQRIASTLTLTRGAVATSGTAARGAHLYDPGARRAGRSTGVGDGDRPDAALGRHLGHGPLRRVGAHERGLCHEGDRLPLDGALTASRSHAPGERWHKRPQRIRNRDRLATFLRKPCAPRSSGLADGPAESSLSAGAVGGPPADTETFGREPADPGRGAP